MAEPNPNPTSESTGSETYEAIRAHFDAREAEYQQEIEKLKAEIADKDAAISGLLDQIPGPARANGESDLVDGVLNKLKYRKGKTK